jgi:hypothetical protein
VMATIKNVHLRYREVIKGKANRKDGCPKQSSATDDETTHA